MRRFVEFFSILWGGFILVSLGLHAVSLEVLRVKDATLLFILAAPRAGLTLKLSDASN